MGTIFPAQLFIPAMIVLFLDMIHLLDRRADAALTTLQPALTASEEEHNQLRYELTTLPAVPTLLASIVAIGIILLLGKVTGEGESSIEALAASPLAANLLTAAYWIGWWFIGAFIYHTIHQLRVINRIHTRYVRVNLFRLRPLYAFSSITAITAAMLAIATYGWTALNPDNLSDPVSIALISLITILAVAVFVWPLLGIHRLLVKEKERLQQECSDRLKASIADLHRRVDDGELEGMTDLNMALASLEIEHGAVGRIPTWPWEPETVRLLITALALPLGLWILQYALQLLVGS
jgi:hypothetical protein